MENSTLSRHQPSNAGPGPQLTALAALALTTPVPTLGVVLGLILFPGPLGRTLFAIGKLWLLVIPILWWLQVEKGGWPLRRPSARSLLVGLASGVVIALTIGTAYAALGSQIEASPLSEVTTSLGLGSARAYLAGAAYWIIVNSLLEEYLYRWFMLRQCTRVLPVWAAVLASAAVFTLHHTVALQVYLPVGFTVLASLGVFLGGCIWAVLYQRYQSVWPGWVSHILADIAVFAVGWDLLGL